MLRASAERPEFAAAPIHGCDRLEVLLERPRGPEEDRIGVDLFCCDLVRTQQQQLSQHSASTAAYSVNCCYAAAALCATADWPESPRTSPGSSLCIISPQQQVQQQRGLSPDAGETGRKSVRLQVVS